MFHNNYYSFTAKLSDVSFLVKNMIDDSIFNEKLGRTSIQNNTTIFGFLDFFSTKVTHLSTGIALSKYINSAHGNWDNYNQNDNFISNTAKIKGPESELEAFNQLKVNLDNPNKLYGIYDWLLAAISAFSTGRGFFFSFFS